MRWRVSIAPPSQSYAGPTLPAAQPKLYPPSINTTLATFLATRSTPLSVEYWSAVVLSRSRRLVGMPIEATLTEPSGAATSALRYASVPVITIDESLIGPPVLRMTVARYWFCPKVPS
eukprot:4679501-Prymnesium_polylepis.2